MEESNTHNNSRQKMEKLNLGSLFFGLMLIVVGLLYFAQSSGFVVLPFFGFYNWPVFILPLVVIFIGLSMLRISNPFAKILGVLFVFLLVVILSCFFFLGYAGDYNYQGYFMGGFRMPHWENINNTDGVNYYRNGEFPMMFRGLR